MSLADTHKKLQQGQGFASLKLIDAYVTTGALPSIHSDMAKAMDMIPADRRIGALDLGACHGLLSVRARHMGWGTVIGVEIDAATVAVYDQHVAPVAAQRGERPLAIECRKLDVRSPQFMPWLTSRCRGQINTVLARRAFPELFSDTYGKEGLDFNIACAAGRLFTEAALHAGIEFIVIEGRKWKGYKSLSNPLFKADNEVTALGSGWREIGRHKECIVLERAA